MFKFSSKMLYLFCKSISSDFASFSLSLDILESFLANEKHISAEAIPCAIAVAKSWQVSYPHALQSMFLPANCFPNSAKACSIFSSLGIGSVLSLFL